MVLVSDLCVTAGLNWSYGSWGSVFHWGDGGSVLDWGSVVLNNNFGGRFVGNWGGSFL